MKNEPIITRKQVRLYFYTKMYEAGHTPTSLAEHLGITRQAVSKILAGTAQPGPSIRKALGLEDVYRLVDPSAAFPPGPKLPEVLKSRAERAASGPKKRPKKSLPKKSAKPKED